MSAADWTLIGWNGVTLEAPADWSLAAALGDRRKGSLRLEDDLALRAEIVWQPVPRRRPLDRIVTDVRRHFERAARRRAAVAVSEETVKLKRRDYRVLRVRAEVDSLNLVYRCEECRRAVVASVFAPAGGRGRLVPLAQRLFDSLHDHARGKRDVWAAYGVRLEVPTDFDLAQSALRVGLVDLSFTRRDWQLDLVRSALAEVQLKAKGLGEWFASAYAHRLRRYATTTERTTFRGHAALSVTGRSRASQTVFRPLRRREWVYARAWHCPEIDKLFIFRLSAPTEAEEEFSDLLATVACH